MTYKNRLIAEFMGMTYRKEKDCFDGKIIKKVISEGHPDKTIPQDGKYHFQLEQLKYHDSWDWLMPVVEKICSLKHTDGEQIYPRTFGMKDEQGRCMFRFDRYVIHYGDTLIEATHKAVISFIQLL